MFLFGFVMNAKRGSGLKSVEEYIATQEHFYGR